MEQNKKMRIEMTQFGEMEQQKMPEAPGVVERKPLGSANQSNFLWKLGKIMIYLLVFLVPIFFLPFTSNTLDFNKQALLLILVFLSLISWLTSGFISNKFEINTSFLNLPVVVFFLVSAFSVIFSIFRYGSFWGLPLPVSQSLLSLLFLVIFYFLVTNLFKKEEIIFLFLTLFASGFLAVLFGIFQFFGKFILPFDFTQSVVFNTVGTQNSLAILSSLLLLLMLPLLFFVKKTFKVILGIFIAVLLAYLFFINFRTAWLVLLPGVAVLFAFGVVNLKKIGSSMFVTLTMAFLIIALLFTLFRFTLPGLPSTSLEVSPTQKTELAILKQMAPRDWVFGSGPGTFIYDWSKYKPSVLNQTIFWATRFSSGASEVLDRTITTGLLGILSLFFLIVVFLKKALQFLLKKMAENPAKSKVSEGANLFLSLGITASFVGLILTLFFYPASFTILFVFWLLLACLAVLESGKRKVIAVNASPSRGLALSFLFVLILVLGIGFSIFYFQKYTADIRYSQGLKSFQAGNNVSAIDYFSRAINLNPQIDVYWRDLSQIYLARLNEVLSNDDLAVEDRNSQIQTLVMSAINSATQATNLNPEDVANWSVRGLIYRNMIGSLPEAEDWAMTSYERASTLEPTNPYIFNEIGNVYATKAVLAEQQGKIADKEANFNMALQSFQKALSLKADYAPANYQMAFIYIREGKTKEAIENLEIARQSVPNDVGLAFQLGVIYYNDNQFDKAKAEFERAVANDPNYSNARYFLGLIYDRQGNKGPAILQFEAIEEFNPENQEVKEILSNLRAGKPALEGIVPSEPPIQEETPENLNK